MSRTRPGARWFVLACLVSVACQAAAAPAEQAILVVPVPGATTRAVLALYRLGPGYARREFGPLPAMLGRNGTAWGRGPLFPLQAGLQKREGDLATPLGVFALGDAWTELRLEDVRWPVQRITADTVAVDDPGSPVYNRIVDRRTIPFFALLARSWERLDRPDGLYRLFFEIGHNQPAIPGAGSAIFLHAWRAPGAPTAGCVALDPSALRRLAALLEPPPPAASLPVVILPLAELARIAPFLCLEPAEERELAARLR